MEPAFTKDMSMDDLMRARPSTIAVLIQHHMLCVGCPIAPFHTLSDACREHRIDLDLIAQHIESAGKPG